MWDLSSLIRDLLPSLAAWSLSHWTTRQVPRWGFLPTESEPGLELQPTFSAFSQRAFPSAPLPRPLPSAPSAGCSSALPTPMPAAEENTCLRLGQGGSWLDVVWLRAVVLMVSKRAVYGRPLAAPKGQLSSNLVLSQRYCQPLSHVRISQPRTLSPPSSFVCGISSGKNARVALPFLSLGDLPDPEVKPGSPALQAESLLSELPGKPSFSSGTLQTPYHVSVGSGLQNAPRKAAEALCRLSSTPAASPG